MTQTLKKTMNDAMSKVLKRLHYPIEVMLVSVRWYAAYPLSLRNLEEMMAERGVVVDHTTVHQDAAGTVPDASPAQAPGRPDSGADIGMRQSNSTTSSSRTIGPSS